MRWSGWSSFYTRATHSPHRKLFFYCSLLQCIVQVALRSTSLAEDARAVSSAHTVLSRLPSSDNVHISAPIIRNGSLFGCTNLASTSTCTLISVARSHRDSTLSNGYPPNDIDTPHMFKAVCEHSMILPKAIFADGEREDTVLLLFQLWLFALAVVGLANDSVAHMAAHLIGQLVNTAWAAFRIQSLLSWHRIYITYVVKAACGGDDILSGIWTARMIEGSVILMSDVTILAVTGYITTSLLKVFMQATYSRVGASPEVMQVHRWVLAFSVALKGAFFLAASLAVWVNKIAVQPQIETTSYSTTQVVASSIGLALVPVWLFLGWTSVRLESMLRFAAFCVLSCLFGGILSAIFASPAFKPIATIWPFFGALTVASAVFLVAAVALGLVCCMRFGRGLRQFLDVQTVLARENFAPATFSYAMAARSGPGSFVSGEMEKAPPVVSDHEEPEHGKWQLAEYRTTNLELPVHASAIAYQESSDLESKSPPSPPQVPQAAVQRMSGRRAPLPNWPAELPSRLSSTSLESSLPRISR